MTPKEIKMLWYMITNARDSRILRGILENRDKPNRKHKREHMRANKQVLILNLSYVLISLLPTENIRENKGAMCLLLC